jgi:hypothetical protein
MVGEFNREALDSRPGAKVADNAIYLMALLHNKIGLTPTPYAYNKRALHFHVECKGRQSRLSRKVCAQADHHCPRAGQDGGSAR